MKRRILFVDDEQHILDGLRRMLWQMRPEWEMVFVGSGAEALEVLAKDRVDVVVTDMRMPRMDGAQLLSIVRKRHPDAVRIVLSGYAENEASLKAFHVSHQYLTKPCDADTFKRVIGRACELRDLLSNEALKRLVSKVESLPSVPVIYTRIMSMLEQPEPSVKEIGRVIAEDLGMSAKILKVVNSAFFGLPRRFKDISHAVIFLGSDTIRSLALFGGLFSSFSAAVASGFDAEALFFHSRHVSGIARQIVKAEQGGKEKIEDAVLAGLMHDVGKLVIAENFPAVYRDILTRAAAEDQAVHQMEMDALGATHAEIGAYLMGLWGLSDPIVEAIAFHHSPSRCPTAQLEPLTAVHAANVLARESETGGTIKTGEASLDMIYLKNLGLADKVPAWRKSAMAPGE